MTLQPLLSTTTKAVLTLALGALFSCQSSSSQENAEASQPQEQTLAADTTAQAQRRPAPDFHVIPPEMAKKRVYICTEEASDIFHVKHDCPVLVQCNATFRNVTLLRAVEDYGRYQCDTCSKELAFIFEEGILH